MIELSIVMVSFNTKDLTVAAIRSIENHIKGISYEIIVVDNGSKDGSQAAIKNFHFPSSNFQLIENKVNVGFAAANNLGAKKAKGKYILLLNSDTLLKSDILTPIVKWMDGNAGVGIYSCSLRNRDGSIQPTGGYFPTLSRVISWMLFIDDLPFVSMFVTSFHPKPSFYRFKHELDWVTGAFFLTRREIWEDLKGFDEQYFMYMEEVDFCYRARKKWKVLYNPDFSLIHYGGASSKSIFPIVSEFKGLRIFYKKYFPGWQLTILRGVLKLGSVMRMILFSIVKGPKEANVYEEAFIVA